jgi:hypothetical protein
VPQTDSSGKARIRDIAVRWPGQTPIAIRVFPADPRFADEVQRVVDALAPSEDGAAVRRRIETELRRFYPRTTVHERTDFGAPDYADRLWYVLRDGRIRTPDPRIERLLSALAVARDVKADAVAAVDRAREVVAIKVGSTPRGRPGDVPAEGGGDD